MNKLIAFLFCFVLGFQMTTMQQNNDENEQAANYRSILSEAMQVDLNANHIFSYRKKTPLGFIENKSPMHIETKSKSRFIPKTSDRMLDAPDFNSNFCTYNTVPVYSYCLKIKNMPCCCCLCPK